MKSSIRQTIGVIKSGEYIRGKPPVEKVDLFINEVPEISDSLGKFIKLVNEGIERVGPFIPPELVKKDD